MTLFPFTLTENELTWDTSDWESAWDSGDNKEEEATSASKVCSFVFHQPFQDFISGIAKLLQLLTNTQY